MLSWIEVLAQGTRARIKEMMARHLADDIARLRTASFDSGRRKGHAEGYRGGFEAGESRGREEGLLQGRTLGWNEGFEEGQASYRIVDERTPFVPKPIDDALYGPRRLGVTPTNIQRMRDEVAVAAARTGSNASHDRSTMISPPASMISCRSTSIGRNRPI